MTYVLALAALSVFCAGLRQVSDLMRQACALPLCCHVEWGLLSDLMGTVGLLIAAGVCKDLAAKRRDKCVQRNSTDGSTDWQCITVLSLPESDMPCVLHRTRGFCTW